MNLLLDAILSWRMVKELEKYFSCEHVDSISEVSRPAKDKEIWNYARANDLLIVTNDEDFVDLLNTNGFPPKVILLRTDNQNRAYLVQLLIQKRHDIEFFAASADVGLLEIIAKDSSLQ